MQAIDHPRCPLCNSKRIWKDGLRYTKGGEVLRFICRDCGYRFSQSKPLQNASRSSLNRPSALTLDRQISASETKAAKNLAKVETRTEKRAAGATKPTLADIKGKIVEFSFFMLRNGYAKSTIERRTRFLKTLVERGANLYDPESVKKVIATQMMWSDGTKANATDTYSCFLSMEKMTWDPPRYKRPQTLPFIPTEAEIDRLIASCGKVVSTYLQGLKETGADPGELIRIEWTDINKEACTITINHPVKGHDPRIVLVSAELIRRLEALPKKSDRVFNTLSMYPNFYKQRRTAVEKLNNPRLRKITFTTLRHFKATMEYHKTKDILHVKQLLGHKSIQNTLIYINLEKAIFQNPQDDEFTARVANNVEEACSLIEVGFEYVTGEYKDGGKIFRKRK